jgi:hypothetical protein
MFKKIYHKKYLQLIFFASKFYVNNNFTPFSPKPGETFGCFFFLLT